MPEKLHRIPLLALYVFLSVATVASALQAYWLTKNGMLDQNWWAQEAQYVQHGDIRQFDPRQTYGHPGGPVIEGTMFLHIAFRFSYDNALLVFMIIANGLLIAGIAALAFLLRPHYLWWATLAFILPLDRLYVYATPPSLLASLLVVFFFLYTVFLCERHPTLRTNDLFLWGLVAGVTMATRFDIGSVTTVAFLLLLVKKLDWKKLTALCISTYAAFVVANPFMWEIPWQHIADLISKMLFHYADYGALHMGVFNILSVSFLALVSATLAAAFLAAQKKLPKPIPLPEPVLYTLLALTALLYLIYSTAHYQAPRYFTPIILVWETLLPLFLLYLTSHTDFTRRTKTHAEPPERWLAQSVVALFLVAWPVLISFGWLLR